MLETFKLYPPGIPSGMDEEELKVELGGIPKQLKSVINQFLIIKPVKKLISHPGDHVAYEINFNPTKPLKQVVDFMLIRQTGGQWRYKLQLASQEPEINDTITIYSVINKTASVAFKLDSKSKRVTTFKAYYSGELQEYFDIHPKRGELNPFGSDPQKFVISFTPREYKVVQTKLVIESEDNYWTFVVRGTFPNKKAEKEGDKERKVEVMDSEQ